MTTKLQQFMFGDFAPETVLPDPEPIEGVPRVEITDEMPEIATLREMYQLETSQCGCSEHVSFETWLAIFLAR